MTKILPTGKQLTNMESPKEYLEVGLKKYREQGIDGLRSQTGKTKHPGKGNPFSGLQNKKNKTREEELDYIEQHL